MATPASCALLCYTLLPGVFGEGWTLEGLSILALSLCNTAGHPRVDEGSWPLTEQGWFVRYKCICLLFLDTKTTLVAASAPVVITPECRAYWVSLCFVSNCLLLRTRYLI